MKAKVSDKELVKVRLSNPCATLEELAEPFGVTRQAIHESLRRKGLPTRSTRFVLTALKRICPRCGGNKEYGSKHCFKCYHELHWVPVVCPTCGGITYRGQGYLIYRISKVGQQDFFCSKKCQGKWKTTLKERDGVNTLRLLESKTGRRISVSSYYLFHCKDCKATVERYRNLKKCPKCGSKKLVRLIKG